MNERRGRARFATLVTAAIAAACGSSGNELGYLSASARGDMQHAEVSRMRYDADLEVACGPGGLTPAGDGILQRWPYLQKVTAGSAEVLFTSEAARSFRVVARTPEGELLADVPALRDTEVEPSTGEQYVASLAGLPPGSIVCYELVADGEVVTAVTGFRTPPELASAATTRFVAVGDVGAGSSDQLAVLDQMQQVPMELIVMTGDIAYENGTPTQLDRNFFGVYRHLLGKVPVFPASGNHDYRTDDARPFRDAFSLFTNGGVEGEERWYSFDWGLIHFVVLDTEKLGATQREWLDADLGAHDRPWTVVVAHRPPYSSGDHGSDLDMRRIMSPIFEAHRVPLVLVGHDHNYERTKPINGVVYVVTGGGGRGTREVGQQAFTAVSDRVAHFVWAEADAAQMRLVAVDAMGQPFDSVAFQRP